MAGDDGQAAQAFVLDSRLSEIRLARALAAKPLARGGGFQRLQRRLCDAAGVVERVLAPAASQSRRRCDRAETKICLQGLKRYLKMAPHDCQKFSTFFRRRCAGPSCRLLQIDNLKQLPQSG